MAKVKKLHLLFCSWEIPAWTRVWRIPAGRHVVESWLCPHSATCTCPHQHWQDPQRCLERNKSSHGASYIVSHYIIVLLVQFVLCSYSALGICTYQNITISPSWFTDCCKCFAWYFTLSDIDKVTLSFAAQPLCKQVSVICDVLGQRSSH